MVDTWPYWIELGVSLVFAVFTVVVAYGSRDAARQWKFGMTFWVYALTAVVAGAMALGQTYFVRDDGVETQWGRWALFTATHGPVVAVIVLSFTPYFIDTVLGLLLGTGSALFLLFGVLTPIQNGGNDESAGILWVVASGLCVLGVTWLLLGVALGMRRFVLFPLPYRSTDGRANMINRWWYVALTVAVFAGLALYTILFAVGPEGWRVYTSEFDQIWLTMALADGLVKFIVLPLVFYFVNADGQVTGSTAFEVFAAEQPIAAAAVAQQQQQGAVVSSVSSLQI